MKQNKGFSLIEMVVAIAIMLVLGSVVFVGLSSVLGVQVTECTDNIENALNKVRANTMGKDATVLKIYQGTDSNYYTDITTTVTSGPKAGSTTETKKIGKSGVQIRYTTEENIYDYNNVNVETIDNVTNKTLEVEFSRSSGEVKLDGSNKCCRTIWVIKGSKVKKITLYQETGKIVVE